MRLTVRAIGHVSEDAITSKTREDVLAIFAIGGIARQVKGTLPARV